MQQLVRAIQLVVGAILPIVNPVGSAPMLLAMTHGADSKTRSTLAVLPSVGIAGGTISPKTSP
jgi:small neutral amino acid transporter SnatA (MarC family)